MFLERVRRALAPDYEVLAEIAGGGMGIVYAARQRRLDRPVAIKILRPELATAIAAERFLAEGRVLARLSDPAIIPIYAAGEADGLLYYVMELVEGETLAARLSRGALPAAETLALARDLLGALAVAHAQGVVHRDVKPANLFLRRGRALLGDFGIARWRESGEAGYTTPGQMIGTPRYMAPEQRDGHPATERTDVYAAGLVLWEAATGEPWPPYREPETAQWNRLPHQLASAVRRALALEPADRWSNAGEFQAALAHASAPRPRLRLATLAALLLAGAAVAFWGLRGPDGALGGGGLSLVVERWGGGDAALGDSVARVIRGALAGYPDWTVLPPGQGERGGALRLGGTLTPSGQGPVLRAHAGRGARERTLTTRDRQASGSDWRAAADSVAADLVEALWAEYDSDLPSEALPRGMAGRLEFFRAEQLWSRAQWEAAGRAYRQAQQLDPTCLICAFRLVDIARWLGEPVDSANLARLAAEQDRLSPMYRALLQARLTPRLRERLEILQHAYRTWPKSYLVTFEYGDELFHRGPLAGHRREKALDPLRQTVRLAPRFWPGWEHLAFYLIGAGDPSAAAALDTLGQVPPISPLAAGFGTLLRLGYSWRFLDPAQARRLTEGALQEPAVRSNLDVTAGARLLLTMDAPRGAVELGGLLQRLGVPRGTPEGLLGQLNGYAALGRIDSLPAIAERFRRDGDESHAVLALALEMVLRCFDPDPLQCDHAPLKSALARRIPAGPPASPDARSAAWALGLLAARAGDSTRARELRGRLALSSGTEALAATLDAAALSRRDPAATLRALPVLPPLEEEATYQDPLLDAVVRLLRAEAFRGLGDLEASRLTLRWHEHLQLTGHLTGPPQAGEMAWALGTLARWQRARLLDSLDAASVEHCLAYEGVARLWSGAPPPFGARADSARGALARLQCG